MDKFGLAVSAIASLAVVILIAPGILAINRGKVLRNIALWLLIFLFLGLIHKNFGPRLGSPFMPYPDKNETQTPAMPSLEKEDSATGVQL